MLPSLLYGFQKLLCPFEILWGVDAYDFNICQAHPDAIAVFEPAQLLQTLSQFKWRLWQLGDLSEYVATIGIEPKVFEVRELSEPITV